MSLLRRRGMLKEAESPATGLLEQGTIDFNDCEVVISGRHLFCSKISGGTDSYNAKRYVNVTDFSKNETTGTGNTADISNQASGKIIPAGATCSFSATNIKGKVSASYQYVAVCLRNTGSGDIKRIGTYGQNVPATSATWTQANDIEIGCIAIEFSHFRVVSGSTNKGEFDLSLTVNGEEWL